MATAELRGVISGDASEFVAASTQAQRSLGALGKTGATVATQLQNVLGGTGTQRDALGRFTKNAGKARDALGRFKKEGAATSSIFSKLRNTLGKVGRSAIDAGKSAASAFRSAGGILKDIAIGATAVVAALAAIGGAAVVNFAKFQTAFSQVRTLVDESQVDVQLLSDGVRELSVRFGVDVTEATRAAYQAISAGQDPANVVNFLATAFENAAAGAATVVESVDLLTSALNVFESQGLTAEQASDILFKTVELGKTTIAELAASFGQVGPIAAAAGVSFADLGAALATTTAQGLSTAEASTAIKAAIAGIVNPAKGAAGALESIGVSARSLREEGLVATFERIGDATGGAIENIVRFLPNIRAVNAAAILAGSGLDKFRAAAEGTSDSTGAASRAFEKLVADIARTFSIIRQTLTDTFRQIGEALTPIVGQLGNVFSAFAMNTRTEVIALTRVLGARFADAGDSIEDFEATVSSSGGAISLGLSAVSAVLEGLADAFNSVARPVGAIAASFEFLATILKSALLSVVSLVTIALNGLLQIIVGIPEALIRLVSTVADFIPGLDGLVKSLDKASTGLKDIRDEAQAFSDSLEESQEAAVKAAEEFDFSAVLNESAKAVREVGTSFAEAANDVEDFGEEVAAAVREAQARGEIVQLGSDLKTTAAEAKGAAEALTELGEAGAGATAGLNAATTATTGLSQALQGIAGGSSEAARGLADLGPKAMEVAEAIAGIGAAQTDEQALARRQEAIANLIAAADAELSKAITAARDRGREQLQEAEANLRAAQATAQEAAGTEVFAAAFREERRAADDLEATVRSVNDAFNAQRALAREVFDSVIQDIGGIDGALEVFRTDSIAKAATAGRATTAEARRVFDREVARLREARAASEIEDVAFFDQLNAARARLNQTVEDAGDTFERARDQAEAAFDLGTQTASVNELADALTGPFAEAVQQAREDAETFGFSQEELNEALKGIVEQSEETGESVVDLAEDFEDLGESAKDAAADLKESARIAEEAATSFENASARLTQAQSFARTGVGVRSGGETQAQVNARFGGLRFGIQQQPRTTGRRSITGRAISESGQIAPRGILSFDLGGPVRTDQLARLQAGETVLSRFDTAALRSILGSRGGGAATNIINVSPTFNIEGGNAEDNRAMARSLIPEITRAVDLGVVGKGVL
ncbi:hypothetical protein LCGC14_0273440 [marine sediment metagenome]|uniref:Phage tail tape measure protein n=2 Tax=root TaxID=1 RepID=A0A9C9TJ97_9HYPH|nr:phage tail tape measure protein [Aurantimonas coralicida]